MNTQPTTASSTRHHLFRFIVACGRAALLALVLVVLVSCGRKGELDGTYSSAVQSYTFDGETAAVSVMGKKIGDMPYTVEGKKVTLKGPGGDLVLTMNDDGSLSDPASDKLVKK